MREDDDLRQQTDREDLYPEDDQESSHQHDRTACQSHTLKYLDIQKLKKDQKPDGEQ